MLPAAVGSQEGEPGRDTPRKVVEAWLRFHDEELCQGIDAVFAFNASGREVHGFFDDRSLYGKFVTLLQPLRNSYKIDLHLDRRQEEKTPDEKKDKDPPPSLWQNYELRSFLGDAAARTRERVDYDEDSSLYLPPPSDMLKERLMIYAEQVLGWNRKIEGYAKHLPALIRVARDPALPSGLRARAGGVVMAHVRNMNRLAARLRATLEPAFPRAEKPVRTNVPGESTPPPKDIVDQADRVSEYAQTVSQRVSQFIYPEHYTVALDELRRPSLLESLKTLQQMDSEFQKVFAKTK